MAINMHKKDPNNDDIVYEESEKKAKKHVSDDVVMDDENEAPEALAKKLKEKIKILEKEKQEYMDGWQRERADFINYKKRIEGEKAEIVKYATENLIADLIPVFDSFEMAFANKEAWEKVDKNWRTGVEYIHSQLVKALADNGFKEINPIGERFDPKYHVAVEHKEIEDKENDGIIVHVKKKGYMLNDKIVIAPQVVVAEYKK